jgi:hypothetical protein
MPKQLTTIELIPLPDVRRVGKLCSLPQWVEERLGALKSEPQPDATGKHRMVPVLPMALILGRDHKSLIEHHVSALERTLAMTPTENPKCAEVTMIAVSKMGMVLAGRESGEYAAEARGEAYMDALDDVPSWAVQEAIRKWHRAEYGPKHDYKWQPVPATLRELAQIEVYRVRSTLRRLGELMSAVPLVEFTDEHRADMRARLSALAAGALNVNRSVRDEATGEKLVPASAEENAA